MKKSKGKGATMCGMSLKAQKQSVRNLPKSVGRHKNPEMKPIGGKAMTGGKTK